MHELNGKILQIKVAIWVKKEDYAGFVHLFLKI